MSKFGDVYRWTGSDRIDGDGAGRTVMMIEPSSRQGLTWTGIDLVEWGGDIGGVPGGVGEDFSLKLGSDAHNWEKVECTETVEPTSGSKSSR